jgi:cytochrome P450/NADPH-cytochrome P450 reductase
MPAAPAPIPYPPRIPFLGNLHQIPKGKISHHLLETSRAFDGIFELSFAGKPGVFITSPDLVAELSDERRFRKVISGGLYFVRALAGDGLFTARSDEENWGKAHRILMPAFSQRAMKGYFGAMLEIAEQLVAHWHRKIGQDIHVADDMTRLTFDTIALAGFDYRFDSFARPELHPFLDQMVRVLAEAMAKITRMKFQKPFARDKERQFAADIADMNKLVDDVIKHRRAHPSDATDLLNLMLEAKDPETGEKLDDTNIRYQILTFLIAGHETTSGLLTFCLYLLLRHPLVLAQAYAEVDRILPGDTVPEYRHIAKFDVIDRVLKETLRLWPTAPAYMVAPYENTTIGGKYRLHQNQPVTILANALQRDAKAWPDPDRFDIERWTPENEKKHHPHAYKPFGNGMRACIGRQLALTEAKLAIALILKNFALSDPYDYKLDVKQTLTVKPEGFRIHARRRLPSERFDVVVPAAAQAIEEDAGDVVLADTGRAFQVLYGTSLGTCREIAEQIVERLGAGGSSVDCGTLDNLADGLPDKGTLIVVTSTYNGSAPDSATKFETAIRAGEFADTKRSELEYAVLGCGNTQWQTFQAFPKLVDATLRDTGAKSIVPRGEADASGDFDGAIEAWMNGLWKVLGAKTDETRRPALTIAYESEDRARSAVLPEHATELFVLGNDELVRDPTGLWDFAIEAPRSSTRHMTLQLPEGVTYAAGDHLAVYARNRPDIVAKIIERLHLNSHTVVTLQSQRMRHLPIGRPVTIRQLLSDFIELQDPVTRKDMRELLNYTQCPHTRGELEKYTAEGEAAAELFQKDITQKRVTLYDLLMRFPALDVPLEAFLGMCSAIRPRFYSISSSPLCLRGAVNLTVGTLAAPAWSGGGQYQGVASTYMQGRQAGETVLGFVRRPNPPFAPPADPSVPMILVGPGTGFAPFRGFLQQRAEEKKAGKPVAKSLLFYGCRHPDHDWFYKDEMQAWAGDGVADVHVAFSTVPRPHKFVQDALTAERDAVWDILEKGGLFYVCGDGRFMAPAVRTALIKIHMEKQGSSFEKSSEWLESMVLSGRYHQDTFG